MEKDLKNLKLKNGISNNYCSSYNSLIIRKTSCLIFLNHITFNTVADEAHLKGESRKFIKQFPPPKIKPIIIILFYK